MRAHTTTRRAAAIIALAAFALTGCSAGGFDPVPVSQSSDAELDVTLASEETEAEATGDEPTLAMPEVVYEVYLSRDPFEPVRELPEPEGAEGTGDEATGDVPPPGDAPQPVDGDDGTGTPAPTPDDECQLAEEFCPDVLVTLIEVTSDADGEIAYVQVGTVVHTVREGDVFASSLRVLSIDGTCATFLYGDESFTLCRGSQTLK